MNIKRAFEYVHSHSDELTQKGEIVAGVAFVPGDTDGEFQIYRIAHEYHDDEDYCAFLVFFEGGSLFSGSGTEEVYDGDTLDEFLAEIPDLAKSLNYQVFRAEQFSGMTAEWWLCELYPQLPDPDMMETDRSAFKVSAIKLISELGNSFQHAEPSTRN
ncbi:hypothetical protein [Marinobacter alkaliphilus]|uniref:Uncharacterized protein n=1 Tax=Marinobacter alkaliphilus TaxID=254719 RepID=A0ABZ3E8W1_9GAMM